MLLAFDLVAPRFNSIDNPLEGEGEPTTHLVESETEEVDHEATLPILIQFASDDVWLKCIRFLPDYRVVNVNNETLTNEYYAHE